MRDGGDSDKSMGVLSGTLYKEQITLVNLGVECTILEKSPIVLLIFIRQVLVDPLTVKVKFLIYNY